MKIDCASSGQQAIEMIKAENPRYSAVFMDHMMPGMDGIEATQMIRTQIGTEYARTIPVIALTANAIVGNEEMFLNKGFQAFISKPIDLMKLDSVLRRWVRDKNREKELGNTNVERKKDGDHDADTRNSLMTGITIKGMDTEKCLERFGGSVEILIEVLRSYAKNIPPLLVNLRCFLDEENLTDYAIVVHGIKGSSYGIAAQESGHAAEALEHAAKTGHFDAVKAGHQVFEKIVQSLLTEIDTVLARLNTKKVKPMAVEPDPALLKELQEACAAFNMDRVDKVMTQLESFQYKRGGKVIEWLREQVNGMTFENIINGDWIPR
jgi:CheY-like chemotaxis protein